MSDGARRTGTLPGRTELLGRIEALLDGVAAGTAATVCLKGYAGSGKTALCDAAADRAAARGFRCVRATAGEGEVDLPLAGLSMLLRPMRQDIGSIVQPPDQRAALQAAAGFGGAPVTDRFTLGAALLGLFGAVAEAQPLLVVVDDVQWFDPASADALSFAVRRLRADAVAVVLALRTGESAAAVPPEAGRIAVSGLDPAGITTMLRDVGRPTSAQVAAEIQTATGGLPLAVLETARALSPEQLSGSAPLPDPLPVGARVVEQFRNRLSVLPEGALRAVVVVAVAGLAGPGPVAQALHTLGLDPADLITAEAAEVLVMSADGLVPTHPLLRTAVLAMTPPAELRAVHRALAGASTSDLERYARHLAGAAEGPDELVASALVCAAEVVARRAGPGAAAPLLDRAAAFTEPGERRLERLLGAARALGLAGRAVDAVRMGRAVLAQTVDPTRATDAALVVVDAAFWGAAADEQYALAVDAAERILPVDRDRAVRALGRACIAAAAQGSLGTAARLGERANRPSGHHQPVVGTGRGGGGCRHCPGAHRRPRTGTRSPVAVAAPVGAGGGLSRCPRRALANHGADAGTAGPPRRRRGTCAGVARRVPAGGRSECAAVRAAGRDRAVVVAG